MTRVNAPQQSAIQVLTGPELVQGFRACIRNAQLSMSAAGLLLREKSPAKALAIAQVGQEELGKSWNILTAFALPPDPDDWRHFWRLWRNHTQKAYGAYFYEWLNPVSIRVITPDGKMLDGRPLREQITAEKEVGLYVDFDAATRRFVEPSEAIEGTEVSSRIVTLASLTATAVDVHDTLIEDDPEFRFTAFAELPARISSVFTPQEQVPALYEEFASRSDRYRLLIAQLREGFERSKAHFEELQRKRAERKHAAD